jgi:hypothetical protein
MQNAAAVSSQVCRSGCLVDTLLMQDRRTQRAARERRFASLLAHQLGANFELI